MEVSRSLQDGVPNVPVVIFESSDNLNSATLVLHALPNTMAAQTVVAAWLRIGRRDLAYIICSGSPKEVRGNVLTITEVPLDNNTFSIKEVKTADRERDCKIFVSPNLKNPGGHIDLMGQLKSRIIRYLEKGFNVVSLPVFDPITLKVTVGNKVEGLLGDPSSKKPLVFKPVRSSTPSSVSACVFSDPRSTL